MENEILNILLRLENKIDSLTTRLDTLQLNNKRISSTFNPPTLDYTMSQWLDNAQVLENHVHVIIHAEENPIVTAFKEFIKTNHEQQKMPLYSDNKKLYVYLDSKWECCKDDEIKSIIQDIWRKFLQYIMSISATYENQDEFDVLRMKVMKMRQSLSDVEKTRKSILKWLLVEIAQPQ